MSVLRPDTTFVLHFDAFTHKVCSGYKCHVYDGRVIGQKTMTGADALAFLAAHPATVVNVLHV